MLSAHTWPRLESNCTTVLKDPGEHRPGKIKVMPDFLDMKLKQCTPYLACCFYYLKLQAKICEKKHSLPRTTFWSEALSSVSELFPLRADILA